MDSHIFLASMVAKVLEDGHSTTVTTSIKNRCVRVELCSGLIRYFVRDIEYTASDAVDLIDDIFNG